MLRRLLVFPVAALIGLVAAGAPAQAISGGSPLPAGTAGSVARIDVGGVRGCSGALIAPQWVITTAPCFAAPGQRIVTGAPEVPSTVTVGGRAQTVLVVHPHPDRDVALVQLGLRVTDVAPVALSAAPTAGAEVRLAGYGRTATEWVPDRPTAAPATVGAVATETFAWSADSASACLGDAGGPVLRPDGDGFRLAGLTVTAGQAGCLAEHGDRHDGTAVRVDDLADWIAQNTTGFADGFRNYFHTDTGIGGYNLAEERDQAIPYDYDSTGKADHLVLWRAGAGIVHILKHQPDGRFQPVLAHASGGIGGWDLLGAADQIVPFDYEHTGKADHLLLYRPGTGWVAVLKRQGTGFTAVFISSTGIGGYDLADPADRIVPFDFDHSGKSDHLVVYRPGAGIMHVVRHDAGATFSSIIQSTDGIGGYDLRSAADRLVAFDYDHSGKVDHLVAYRPGSRIAHVLRHTTGATFQPVFVSLDGIGGYNLAETRDQMLAFDYEHTGRLDHLVLYRPGTGIAHILRHGTGNTFVPAFVTLTGIGGYDLKSVHDRLLAFDHDHSGGSNHLFAYRPGSRIAWVQGRIRTPARERVTVQVEAVENAAVEDFSYPGAAAILDELNVRLISGDGRIMLADCATPPVGNVGVVKVYTTEQVGPGGAGLVCFKVSGPTGRLELEVPGVYEIRGDGRQAGYGHPLTAVVDTPSAPPATVVVNPSGSTQVGLGADPNAEPATLLTLRVPA